MATRKGAIGINQKTMAFKPGQSGNPAGRPKKSPEQLELEQLARTYTREGIERLVFWMRSENAKASVAAINTLFDRGFGKPLQSMDMTHSGPEGEPIAVYNLAPLRGRTGS